MCKQWSSPGPAIALPSTVWGHCLPQGLNRASDPCFVKQPVHFSSHESVLQGHCCCCLLLSFNQDLLCLCQMRRGREGWGREGEKGHLKNWSPPLPSAPSIWSLELHYCLIQLLPTLTLGFKYQFCILYLLEIPISCCQGSSYSSWGPNILKLLHYI